MGEVRVPGEPKGDPAAVIDGYEVYAFESEDSATVPDVYVVKKREAPDDPYLRMWVGHGIGPVLYYHGYARHRYGPDDDPEDASDCCAWDDTAEPPEAVERILLRASDAPMVGPKKAADTDG